MERETGIEPAIVPAHSPSYNLLRHSASSQRECAHSIDRAPPLGVSTSDVTTYVAVVLGGLALLAAYFRARRGQNGVFCGVDLSIASWFELNLDREPHYLVSPGRAVRYNLKRLLDDIARSLRYVPRSAARPARARLGPNLYIWRNRRARIANGSCAGQARASVR